MPPGSIDGSPLTDLQAHMAMLHHEGDIPGRTVAADGCPPRTFLERYVLNERCSRCPDRDAVRIGAVRILSFVCGRGLSPGPIHH